MILIRSVLENVSPLSLIQYIQKWGTVCNLRKYKLNLHVNYENNYLGFGWVPEHIYIFGNDELDEFSKKVAVLNIILHGFVTYIETRISRAENILVFEKFYDNSSINMEPPK